MGSKILVVVNKVVNTNRASALTNLNEQELRDVDSAAQGQVKGRRENYFGRPFSVQYAADFTLLDGHLARDAEKIIRRRNNQVSPADETADY
ncbi:MAG: hypothetical protein ACREIM_00385 [Nitrospiraceae bacterium]